MATAEQGFDQKWFERLADLEQDVVSTLEQHEYPNLRPTLGDLRERGLIGDLLPDRATALVERLNGDYEWNLHPNFRAKDRHVFTYTQNRSFRRQRNVALTARPENWSLRVGIGFDVDRSMNEKGLDDYNEFIREVDNQPGRFDNLMEALGGYVEPKDYTVRSTGHSESGADTLKTSEFFLRPDLHPEHHRVSWRFFGARLQFEDPAHRWILTSYDHLAEFANGVFERIEESPF